MLRQHKGGIKVEDTFFADYRLVNSITSSKLILIKTQEVGAVDIVIVLILHFIMPKLGALQ